MNSTRKFFIVFALLCLSAAVAYSQECNSYLRQASELVSQKKYCDAKSYYLKYSKCNADADVSTEIAMCERFCKINVMLEEEDEPVVTEEKAVVTEEKTVVTQEQKNPPSTNVLVKPDIITLNNRDDIQAIVQEIGSDDVKYKKFDNPNGPNYTLKKAEIFMITYANGNTDVFTDTKTTPSIAATTPAPAKKQPSIQDTNEEEYSVVKPVPSVSSGAKIKLGLNGGIVYPPAEGAKTFFGGGISGEYLATPHIGIGISAGYYYNQVAEAKEGIKTINSHSFIPVTLTSKYYFLTQSIQPYAGVDVGLYTELLGAKMKFPDGVDSFLRDLLEKTLPKSVSNSYFGLAPVLGLQFKLSNALALDVNAKTNLLFREGELGYNFGFNVGIVYAFGK